MSKGAGAEVAVVDTGADVAHPDLLNRVVDTLDCDGGCGGNRRHGHRRPRHPRHRARLRRLGQRLRDRLARLRLQPLRRPVPDGPSCGVDRGRGRRRGEPRQRRDQHELRRAGPSTSAPSTTPGGGARYRSPRVPTSRCPRRPTTRPNTVQPAGTGPNIDAGKGLVVTAAKYDGTRAASPRARPASRSPPTARPATRSAAASRGSSPPVRRRRCPRSTYETLGVPADDQR